MGRVLVCGDRNWTDERPIQVVVDGIYDENPFTVYVSGGARGADSLVEEAVNIYAGEDMNDIYPADWEEYGKAAGPIRNQQMLDSGPDEVWAFHDDIQNSKGTKDMCTRAKKAGIPVYVVSRF